MKLANKQSLSGRSLIYGIGVNDANYNVKIKKNNKLIWACPFYVKWQSMLSRCYSSYLQKRKPNYIGCSVTPEWHYFSKFRLWMSTQKWEGMELDKDLLVKGNQVYGPDTCCFIPQAINSLFGSGRKKKNNLDLPENISLADNEKYKVQVMITPNTRYIKTFSILKEACICALEKKIEAVEYGIVFYPELDVRAVFALNREIKEMQEQINNIQNSSPNLFDIA
jgi:hypothetical protein